MNVVRFDSRKGRVPPPAEKRDVVTPIMAAIALIAVCALGWVLVDRFVLGGTINVQGVSQAEEVTEHFAMCGRSRYTCVVDGDTIWWRGQNLRLQSYDTPEPHDGICSEAVQLLTNAPCPFRVFDILRQMVSIRQIEAAELMLGQQNFTAVFARALLVATPENQLAPDSRSKPKEPSALTDQIARLEKELVSLQSQIKSVEETYGIDNLHLTLAKGYLAKLLGNARVVRWLAQNRNEYLGEFQTVAEIESIAGTGMAAEGRRA